MRQSVHRKLGRAPACVDFAGMHREMRIVHGREVLVTVCPPQAHNPVGLNDDRFVGVGGALPEPGMARLVSDGRVPRRRPA